MADTETKINKNNNLPSIRKIRSVLRMIVYNVLFTLAGLVLIALTGEVYLRLKRSLMPFTTKIYPQHFVPKVGMILKPNAEVSWTNFNDFWTIFRTNSLGFLDREPISPERAAASCHITMIGDSFVEAREVPIADKFQVRKETRDGQTMGTGTPKATNGPPKPCSNISRKIHKFALGRQTQERPNTPDGGVWASGHLIWRQSDNAR